MLREEQLSAVPEDHKALPSGDDLVIVVKCVQWVI
jgi:hypothetical protein